MAVADKSRSRTWYFTFDLKASDNGTESQLKALSMSSVRIARIEQASIIRFSSSAAELTFLLVTKRPLRPGYLSPEILGARVIFLVTRCRQYCAPRPWSEQWNQPDSPHRRILNFFSYNLNFFSYNFFPPVLLFTLNVFKKTRKAKFQTDICLLATLPNEQ